MVTRERFELLGKVGDQDPAFARYQLDNRPACVLRSSQGCALFSEVKGL